MKEEKDEIELTNEQLAEIERLIADSRRDVPVFYDEGVCETFYVPVDDGELHVFHHRPEKQETKRPILFAPGFGTTPWAWRDFHNPLHGLGEYYYLETRDKKSARIRRHRKVKITPDQSAKDIGDVIKYLGLDKKDFLLIGTCFCGGAILEGLINRYFNPPTTIVLDPFTKWTQHLFLCKFIVPFIPPFVLGAIRFVLAKIIMFGMENEVQKERHLDAIRGGVPWKWRKSGLQNHNFDINNELKKIENEVFVLHGPKDRYHPDEVFGNIARSIPKGRYFYMPTADENREQLTGVVGKAFASVTKDEGVPPSLAPFEVSLNRVAE